MCCHQWASCEYDKKEQTLKRDNLARIRHKQQMLVMYLTKVFFSPDNRDLELEKKMIQMIVEQNMTQNVIIDKCLVCGEEIGRFFFQKIS